MKYDTKNILKRSAMLLTVIMAITVGGTSAAPTQFQNVTPDDWAYKALITLQKHGALTNTQGLVLGERTYTRYELTPLIVDVVDRRDSMNMNDKEYAVRLYREYMDEIRDYKVAQDKAEKAEKLAKIRKEADEKSKKDNTGTKVSTPLNGTSETSVHQDKRGQNTGIDENVNTDDRTAELDKQSEAVNKPAEKALADEEIKKKMENFTIDDSRVKVSGDVRICYSGKSGDSSKSDGRVRTQVAFKL